MRGADGTGLAYIPKWNVDKPAVVFKKAMVAQDFLDMKQTQALIDRTTSQCAMIGHNRAGTRGGDCNNSAHPFQADHITLVHNGTLTNYQTLATEAPATVDSAYIAAGMAEHGEQETLEKLQGSFALVWHNANTGEINIARNKERPLVWCYDNYDTMWFASEWAMLFAALHGTGHKFTSKFIEPSPYHWYKFKMDGTREVVRVPFAEWKRPTYTSPTTGTIAGPQGSTGGAYTKLTKAERKADAKLQKLSFRINQVVAGCPKSWSPYKKNKKNNLGLVVLERAGTDDIVVHNVKLNDWMKLKAKDKVGVRIKNAQKQGGKTVLVGEFWVPTWGETQTTSKVSHLVKGPGNRMISKAEFLQLTSKGCQQCGVTLTSEDAPKMSWYGDIASPICPACTSINEETFKKGAVH